MLLLNELVGTSVLAHLTFGLLEGWWLAEDGVLRMAGTPALAPERWRQVLEAEGFIGIEMPAEAAHGLGQQIVVAISDGVVRLVQEGTTPTGNHTLPPKQRPTPQPELSGLTTDNDTLAIQVERALTELVSVHLKIAREELDRDTPLSEFGFDSITLTSFSHTLNARYGLRLSPTVFFEAPTIATLAAYLVREHRTELAPEFEVIDVPRQFDKPVPPAGAMAIRRRARRAVSRTVPVQLAPQALEPIAVIGMSGCFPQAEDIDALWANLQAGRDCIGELPASRWGAGAMPTIRHAGVIDGVDEFDPLFFNISPREAQGMDPQQRLLMTYVYKVIEDAGYSVQSLSGSNTALLVGTSTSGYGQMLVQSGEGVTGSSAAGLVGSMGPNRMSYWLNWHGPSEPVDTACSSSLVAVHRAVTLLRSGQCEQAVVGGVNTLLSLEAHESLALAGMLSPNGRCRTFSAEANGYVRSEGVGMLMLKPLSLAERDGDHIYGLIVGSAQNHGGRANSLTAPNPVAQAQLVETAFRQAGVDPRTVGYIEAHGTGTALGDPIEVQGLKLAFRALAGEDVLPVGRIGLGTIKSNLGHLELAAGVAGLIKVLLQMRYGRLVKSLNSEPLNPQVELEGSPFYVVNENRTWESLRDPHGQILPRRAGVSSFGFGGVNAHVVLEEYIPSVLNDKQTLATTNGPMLVVLSARSEERLKAQVEQLVAYLDTHEVELTDLAYTLQVGREALAVRLALVVDTLERLRERLLAYARGEVGLVDTYQGEVSRDQGTLTVFRADEELQEAISKWIARGKVGKLAELWVQGLGVDWSQLYGESRPKRISLPTYPFAKERHWVPQIPPKTTMLRLHPLLDRNSSLLGLTRYTRTLNGDEPHLTRVSIGGQRLMHGLCYLEMARVAGELATERKVCGLKNLIWGKPAQITGKDKELNIVFFQDGREVLYQIYSNNDKMAPHHLGELIFDPNEGFWPDRLNMVRVRSLLQEQEVYHDNNELLARLHLTPKIGMGSLIDSGVMSEVWKFVTRYANQDKETSCFPNIISSIRYGEIPSRESLIRIWQREITPAPQTDSVTTVALYDIDGLPQLVLDGLVIAQLEALTPIYLGEGIPHEAVK
ncbi:type I polyketide synthase [Burkholderia cepacia]|uniref:type I polyketide synthase n=1 Tax=Burkholderia cepacia TaxID=292 RepID=UPI000CF9FD17|nr:beta-ketoacyl synthase N-terminal-like domain-containing protein [Burkholderia cepacia]